MALPLGGLPAVGGGLPVGGNGLPTDAITGNGGPLNTATSLAGDGGPLNTVSSLAGNPTDAVGGLTNGLLGGSQGLNLLGVAGIGSDEDALVDLSPAEKKKVKAQKAAIAKQNEEKRKKAMEDLKKQVAAQRAEGKEPTPEQLAWAKTLKDSQAADDAQMARYEQILGPTDPELYEQAMSEPATARQTTTQTSGGPSQGLFYAYLVNGNTFQPTHLLTFPNAAAANQWSSTAGVEKASAQMYIYNGAPPPVSGRMSCMPISGVQPIIPLQHGDGYPICCKGKSEAGASSTARGAPAAAPAPPPKPRRQKLTFDKVADSYARDAKARGDPRSHDEIKREAMQDLKENCCGNDSASAGVSRPVQSAPVQSAPVPSAPAGLPVGAADGMTKGGLGSATQGLPVGGANGIAPGSLTSAVPALPVGGDLLSGLLPGSQGLNVAGILAIGSDDPATLDLAPGEKKAVKMQKQKQLEEQRQIQDQQLRALKTEIDKNNGQKTAAQQKQLEELQARNQALEAAQKKLADGIKEDEANEKKTLSAAPVDDPFAL